MKGMALHSFIGVAALAVVSGTASSQINIPNYSATGPIEDTSYAAGLPGAFSLIQTDTHAAGVYADETPLFTLTRISFGKEVGSAYTPLHRLTLGYVDYVRGLDAGLIGTQGRNEAFGIDYRLVSISPGRDEMVKELVALNRDFHAWATSGPGHPDRSDLTDRMMRAAQMYSDWSEKPKLALRGSWVTERHSGDRVDVTLAASILRPIRTSSHSVPSGVEVAANLNYAHVRAPGMSRRTVFDPSFGVTWRDKAFRFVGDGPVLSRWDVQLGAVAGVRNEINAQAPLTLFFRVRSAPSQQPILTPRQIAERTTIYTLTARRDSQCEWVYGLSVSFLR